MKHLRQYLSWQTLYPKTLGIISTTLGLSILYKLLVSAAPMANILHLTHGLFASPALANDISRLASFILACIAIIMGYRGIVHNNICLGTQCNVEAKNRAVK